LRRVVLERRVVHVEDAAADPHFLRLPFWQAVGYRTFLLVPMLREGAVIGAIGVGRVEPGGFADKQVRLLQTFADQAVIAIENVRLFNETKEALEQQTATSEILRVISQSQTDVQPVFNTIVKSAARLCDGVFGTLASFDGELLHLVATHNFSPTALDVAHRVFPAPPSRATIMGRAILERGVVHAPDVKLDGEYGHPALTRAVGWRSGLAVPMLRDGVPLGAIAVGRAQPGPFTDQEIALLQTFADQAVIAIENVRLFRELEEKNGALTHALEERTATSEILRVISNSPTAVEPVFEAIVTSGRHLCQAHQCLLVGFDGEMLTWLASDNFSTAREEALRSIFPYRPTRGGTTGRVVLDRAVVHIPDVLDDPDHEHKDVSIRAGARAQLAVPMFRENEVIGALHVARPEPGPFSDAQIALLKTFADQAVIAIENVRLFTELQEKNRALSVAHAQVSESLEQQTATSEILRVISSSPTDVQPVFDTIARNASTLCGSEWAIVVRFDGELIHLAAQHNARDVAASAIEQLFPRRPGREVSSARAILERAVVHIPDVEQDPDYSPEAIRAQIARSYLSAPMLRDGTPIGAIGVSRAIPGPFTPEQIALLQTFADQAVIAIENVRLFTELQTRNRELTEALEQQTATAEVLQVISRSTFDLDLVLEVLTENATRLSGARNGALAQFDGERFRVAAAYGTDREALEILRRSAIPLSRGTMIGRVGVERRTIQILDIMSDPEYEWHAWREKGDARTVLGVPMLREGALLGVLAFWRDEIQPFTEKQIALLQTFADQAVIAIENVRLFKELEEKNKALTTAHGQVTEALDQQTASGEILAAISSSPTDAQPVFDAIARNARRLLDGHTVSVLRVNGDELQLMAFNATDPAGNTFLQSFFPVAVDRFAVIARLVRERTPVIVTDMDTAPEVSAEIREIARARSWRSVIWMPMVRDDATIGMIAVSRRESGEFADSEVGLLKTFAAQAVIAIENVRLFTELQEKNHALTQAHAQVSESLDQQTATSEILRVIASSPTDVNPVFRTILANANRLCDASFSVLWLWDGEAPTAVAHENVSPAMAEALRTARPLPDRRSPLGLSILEQTVVHVADVFTDPRFTPEDVPSYRLEGARSILLVPMVREGSLVGLINIWRREPRAFTDGQIALVRTFADQAVIAIENVRLFKELEEKNQALTQAHAQVSEALEQQTATAEILRVISQSQTELQPVFEAIIDHAMQLFKAWAASVLLVDGQLVRLIAMRGGLPGSEQQLREQSPWPMHTPSPVTFCIANRTVVHIPDIEADHTIDQGIRALGRTRGWRSILAAPIVRDGQPIGAISIQRAEAGAFSSAEIELLKTFTDQAGIAVENTRLLGELRARTSQLTRSVEELTALSEISRALSSTLDLDVVLRTIVTRASQLAGADACSVFEYDEATEAFHLRATHNLDEEVVTLARQTPTGKGEGVQGRMAVTRQPVQVPDISEEDAYRGPLRDVLLRTGTRAVLAIPMLRENELIGGLTVNKGTPGEFSPEVIELLKTFATQSALAIQNARLFRELADKSRQLEVASQHKSEFLANMSHELRTPLNAIIGYSEMLQEEARDAQQDAFIPDLEKINAAAKHQLGLINDILDLSKVEAGKMELELANFHLPTAIDNAVTLVRERAARRGIALQATVDSRLGELRADERKIKQVVLNLLSNAIKFTPEGGRIDVEAHPVEGGVEVSVSDTGVGIAPEDQDAVFEEFRQVGASQGKQEGTGLGLTLCRKFVELHGGRIWVKSQTGVGSTFTFVIPERPKRTM
jgi:GAF domain-containing protein/anti-sigma regulatory factor (Ser/Thr protein kinase)